MAGEEDVNPYAQFVDQGPPTGPPEEGENPYAKFAQAAPEENPYAKFAQPQQPEAPERTWGQEIGRDLRTGVRSIIPTTAGVLGGLAAGAVGAAAGPVGAIGGGIAGGAVAGAVAQKAQDAAADWLGIDSEEQRAADAAKPSIGSTVAEFAPAAITLNAGSLSERLAQRLLTGGIMGAVDVGTQAVNKGISNIDPTEAAVAAGTGAVLPGVRPWAGAAAGAVAGLAGEAAAGRAASMYKPTGEAAPAETPGVDTQPQVHNTPQATSDRSPPSTPGHLGTAQEPTPVPGARTSLEPGQGIEARPNEGFQGKVGDFGTDGLKDSVTAAKDGIPGAESTPLVISDGDDPFGDPAIKAAMPNDGEPLGVGAQPGLMGGTPPEPTPPAPPPRPVQPQAEPTEPLGVGDQRGLMGGVPEEEGTVSRPPAAQQAINASKGIKNTAGQPRETPEARQQLIDQIFPKEPGPPDVSGIAEEPAKVPVNEKPTNELTETPSEPAKTGEMEDIPDFLKRTPKSLSGAAAEGEKDFTSATQTAIQRGKISGITKAIGDIGPVNWFRTAFTPEGLSEATNNFENTVREGQGVTNQKRLLYNKLTGDLSKAINSAPADAREEFARTFQDGTVPKSNPLSQLASSAHVAQKAYDARLAKVDPDGNFQANLLPNFFADREGVKNFLIDREDSGAVGPAKIGDVLNANFKLRPDLLRQDGSVDPVQLMQNLHNSYDRFLEGKYITNKAIDDGIIFDHDAPGTVPLEAITRGSAPLYAEPEVATMWNRYFGQHVTDPTGKDFYDTALKAKNVTTAWQLLGGGYHFVAETTEAINGAIMQAVQQAASGRFGEAGKRLIGAPTAPYRQATRSASEALEGYFNPQAVPVATRKVVEYLTKAGMTSERIARYTPELNSAQTGFFKGWSEAANKLTLNELGEQARKGPLQAGKSAFQLLGKSMQTVMEPLFNTYIPRLKIGAAFEQMSDYYAANQGKSDAHYQEIAKRILKSTDDRLGELNQSTLFWNTTLKKAANLLMISPGWETGTLRSAIGGAGSFIKNPASIGIQHPDFHPNAAFPFAFAVTTAAVGMIYQFLKTGEVPKDVRDPFFPKTGGTSVNSNQPERAIMPGYLKDVYSWWHGLTGSEGLTRNASSQLYNKLALVPRATWDTMANKDWAGKQIYNPSDPLHEKMRQYLQYVQENIQPIALKQTTGGRKGTNITKGEAFAGVKHAPAGIEKPQQAEEGIAKANKRAQEEATKFRERIKQ